MADGTVKQRNGKGTPQGGVISPVSDDYKDIKKLFLPIASIEKYLYSVIIGNPNDNIIKVLNDKYFTIKSIDTLSFKFLPSN